MGKSLPQPQKRNPRGIPQAPFIDSVTDYVDNEDEANTLLGQLYEMHQKYQFMQMATEKRKDSMVSKIPALKESLDAVKFLQLQREPFDTQYQLNDTVFAKAEVHPTKSVWLWLGANVMLEFPLDEARGFLENKVNDAEKTLGICNEDLEFLRENITTTEVNSARVINWQVQQKKGAK